MLIKAAVLTRLRRAIFWCDSSTELKAFVEWGLEIQHIKFKYQRPSIKFVCILKKTNHTLRTKDAFDNCLINTECHPRLVQNSMTTFIRGSLGIHKETPDLISIHMLVFKSFYLWNFYLKCSVSCFCKIRVLICKISDAWKRMKKMNINRVYIDIILQVGGH